MISFAPFPENRLRRKPRPVGGAKVLKLVLGLAVLAVLFLALAATCGLVLARSLHG